MIRYTGSSTVPKPSETLQGWILETGAREIAPETGIASSTRIIAGPR
jgi:hypothetical protein